MKPRLAICVLSTLLFEYSYCQREQPVFPSACDMPEAISFFAPFIFPKILQDEYQLKQYVQSAEFAAFRTSYGDVNSVDAIFAEALRLSWGNAYEALFISLLATMEHHRVDVRIPVIGIIIPLPLTSEFEDEFRQRVKCLPGQLYPDSPPTPFGDKDKLQHFFGSALATYTSESGESADALGNFIESKENTYVPGEEVDTRDIRTNGQGQAFALALLADKQMRPSEFILRAWPKAKNDSGSSPSDSISTHVEHP